VGQYQHDLSEHKLSRPLDAVVKDCVNAVGVDVNTASTPLLSRVSGVGEGLARSIVSYGSKDPQIVAAGDPAGRAFLLNEMNGSLQNYVDTAGIRFPVAANSVCHQTIRAVCCAQRFVVTHDGEDIGARPLIERKARLAALLSNAAPPLHYTDYHRGQGPAFHE